VDGTEGRIIIESLESGGVEIKLEPAEGSVQTIAVRLIFGYLLKEMIRLLIEDTKGSMGGLSFKMYLARDRRAVNA
jgi:hypothetical protein